MEQAKVNINYKSVITALNNIIAMLAEKKRNEQSWV
jgi:hypothetical protein